MDVSGLYGVFKVFHIVSVVAWFAVLFYLPRLFVYHVQHMSNEHFTRVVQVQERKLYYCIGYPAMLFTLCSGLMLILASPGIMSSGGWLHAKLLLVALLVLYHLCCGHYIRALRYSAVRSGRFFRIYNEFPTLALILIVTLVVIKPF